MITLDLNVGDVLKKVKIKEDVLFNAMLAEHPEMIKALIKATCLTYKVSDAFFTIVNNYIDFDEDGISIYPGLIVRTGPMDYAVLYLESSEIDEEYMISLIKEFIYDVGDLAPAEININQFEISKSEFLSAARNI